MEFTFLHIISGPVIGAVIGAFTNYIAIKMLFRPLKPVRIGKFTLPFTPGVIPRHQQKLAEAISDTVYQNFFTTSDIENIFMSEEMAGRFSKTLLNRILETDLTDLKAALGEDSELKVKEAVYNLIHRELMTADIAGIVTAETEKIIQQKIRTGFITSLLLKDNLAKRIAGYAGNQMADYIREHDLELLLPIFLEEEALLKGKKIRDLILDAGLDAGQLLPLLQTGYYRFMAEAKTMIAEGFHMKQFIYDRVMELDPADIERLVNEAIHREMNYLVYLGGFLGLLIGIVNIFL